MIGATHSERKKEREKRRETTSFESNFRVERISECAFNLAANVLIATKESFNLYTHTHTHTYTSICFMRYGYINLFSLISSRKSTSDYEISLIWKKEKRKNDDKKRDREEITRCERKPAVLFSSISCIYWFSSSHRSSIVDASGIAVLLHHITSIQYNKRIA